MTENHKLFLKAIESFSETRALFEKLTEAGEILGNDNHIGDIGEYWIKRYYESIGESIKLPKKKNELYDLIISSKDLRVSVKTKTPWSKTGMGTQIKTLKGEENPWFFLAAVDLGENLFPQKIAIISLSDLMKQENFKKNEHSREHKGTKAYPRFRWWNWLEKYLVKFEP